MRTKIFVFTILSSLLFGLNFVFAQEQIGERAVQIDETPLVERCESNLGNICSNQEV